MKHLCLALIVIAVFLAGCSGGSSNPVAPEKSSEVLESIPLINLSDVGGVKEATGLFGAYELTINPDEITAELVSKRFGTIGDSYIVSGVSFFTMTPCADCMKVAGVSLDLDGNIWLKFDISHPFDEGDTLKPPSAINRLDLDVFDLALVVCPTGVTAQAFTQSAASAYNLACVGASGYTTELANYLSDPAAMPYFLCVDDSTDASPPVSTWNEFAMGSSTIFEAGFSVTGPLTFDTYLTMGYGHSAVKSERLIPKYYNPEFNRKAAWKVNANPPAGTTVGTTWDDNDSFPQNVVVEVYDWQIGATVSTEPDFGDADPTHVFSISEPTEVTVEVLGMSTVLPTTNTPNDPLATGMPDDPWVYTVAVPNDNLPAGNYPGLVCVTDSRVPLGVPPTDQRDYLIDSPDGILLDFYDIDKFATYQAFEALVVVGCGPITGQIDIPATCPVTGVANGASITFVASATSSNGGTVQEYEADLDYDGITFDIDASDPDGDFGSLGPFINPNCGTPPEDPVTYTVAIRAYDDCVPPNYEILGTCDITVELCNLLPIGDVVMKVERVAASGVGHGWQFDPDGPWTLSWAANASAVEFAIYYDDDAGDYTLPTWTESELTDNLVYVDVSTTTSYTVPTTHLPTTHYSSGMTYVVKGRTVAGDSGSEFGDSEPAFIMINGWETISQQYSIIGVPPAASEGWHATKESSNPWDQSSTTAVRAQSNVYHSGGANYWVAHGQCYGRSSRNIGQLDAGLLYLPGNYEGFTTRVPTVPNTTTRFLEFSVYVRGSMNNVYDGGLIIGSYSGTTQPVNNWTDPNNFNWAEPESTAPYHGYDGYSPEVENWFNMPSPAPNPNAFVGVSSTTFYTYLFGCDVGTSATPDPFIGVVDCRESYPTASIPLNMYWMQLDEVAIMIY